MSFRLDLHVHSAHSRDARGSVMDLAMAAQGKGLHGFALTDHDTIAGHGAIQEAAQKTGILIVPGIEVSSAEGHILAIGVTGPVPRGLGTEATAELVRDLGGIAVAAHPLRLWTGMGPTTLRERAAAGVLHAAEAQNARERRIVQANTERLCIDTGLSMTGGSDAHWVHDIGNAWTRFEEPLATPGDVVDAITQGACRAEGRATPRHRIIRHQAGLAVQKAKRAIGR